MKSTATQKEILSPQILLKQMFVKNDFLKNASNFKVWSETLQNFQMIFTKRFIYKKIYSLKKVLQTKGFRRIQNLPIGRFQLEVYREIYEGSCEEQLKIDNSPNNEHEVKNGNCSLRNQVSRIISTNSLDKVWTNIGKMRRKIGMLKSIEPIDRTNRPN